MMWLAITWIPTWVESFLDRKGETKKGKRKDFWWTIVVAIVIAGGAWWLGKSPLTVAGLILIWRVTTFDYITNALLKRYSEGHKNINIFTFTGTVAFTDKLTAKVHPALRLVIRLVVFALAVWWYTSL